MSEIIKENINRQGMLQHHKILNLDNLENEIVQYQKQIDMLCNYIHADSPLKLMQKVKRDPVGKGPYPNVSFFEAANRILTDCVIFNSARTFLDKTQFPEIKHLHINLGHSNPLAQDIMGYGHNDQVIFIAEAFNTSISFFRTKMYKAKARLNTSPHSSKNKYLVYNEDACENYKPKDELIKHLKVPALLDSEMYNL